MAGRNGVGSASTAARPRMGRLPLSLMLAACLAFPALPATAQQQLPPPAPIPGTAPAASNYSTNELVAEGNRFFGDVSSGLANVVEKAVAQYGQPNGYILGQEGSGAIFGGLRYGEGVLYTRNSGNHTVYWQGPTLGFDLGADGARTMMLVYDLPAVEAIYQRFGGVDGSAYLVGGFGMTVLRSEPITLVPVRSGLGGRLGINVGYLKFTPQPTWNPF